MTELFLLTLVFPRHALLLLICINIGFRTWCFLGHQVLSSPFVHLHQYMHKRATAMARFLVHSAGRSVRICKAAKRRKQ